MKNNTKSGVNFFEELRAKMRKGDRQLVAEKAGCHPITLDQALDGKEGEKRDKALDTLIAIINQREEKKQQRENQFKTK